jgi:hypothetical protein
VRRMPKTPTLSQKSIPAMSVFISLAAPSIATYTDLIAHMVVGTSFLGLFSGASLCLTCAEHSAPTLLAFVSTQTNWRFTSDNSLASSEKLMPTLSSPCICFSKLVGAAAQYTQIQRIHTDQIDSLHPTEESSLWLLLSKWRRLI